jgi:CxxC motif-containing protein (DUF1111 family)
VLRGKAQFHALGCAACHVPTWRHRTDGADATPPEAADQTIFPYTDLLLHDMGPELADGRPDFLEATGDEWRTPPLWGIGLRRDRQRPHRVPPRRPRPRSLQRGGAVARRRGPSPARDAVHRRCPPTERADLLAFLASL